MRVLTPEAKVGVFTILAGVGLLIISFKTAGVSLLGDEAYMRFAMNFSTVAGVEEKSKVRLSGVEIGYVDRIILEDNHARVMAQLTRDAKIRKNAMATIRTAGLLGERYIEIEQGTPDAPLLQDGETLLRSQDPADISDMLNKLGGALDDIRDVTSSVKSVFGSLEGQKTLKSALENIDAASATFKVLLAENQAALLETTKNFATISREFAQRAPNLADNLERSSSDLRELLDTNKENVNTILTNLNTISDDLKVIIEENRNNLNTTLERTADAAATIDQMMTSIKNMSDAMEKVAVRINEGEGTVGKLVSEEEIYEKLNSTLEGAQELVGKADSVKLSLGMRVERQREAESNKGYISLLIAPREDKHYILEVTEDVRNSDLSDDRTTLNNLLYTIMIAKRFSDLTLRGGLIESSAGLGADYHLFNDNLVASAEIFNLSGYNDKTPDPQIKAELKLHVQDYFYLYLGGDELLNEEYRTYLFGGGVIFGEDDLKLAIGLF